MRILLVDDHPFMRKGIKEALAEAMDMVEVTEASDGNEAFGLLLSRSFDLVIVDIVMPGKDGLALIRESLAQRPRLHFLVMSVYSEREFAERAYRCGARGYLSKDGPPEELLVAVRRILGGKIYVSPEYASLLIEGRCREAEGPGLSDRELSVLRHFARGESLTEIGRRLNLSVKTISTYKTRCMEKLGVETNAGLIAWAMEHRL